MHQNIRVICLFVLCMAYVLLANGTSLKDTIITIHIYPDRKAQTIDNFGSSGCWFSEGIGKYWPAEKKEKIASLLFSRKFDSKGQPEGIGLSAWRFNIGAGTLEQGDSSGIRDFRKRSDSFLNPDGTYNWTKQAGHRFFLQRAKDYGVETLIAFSNSPPVQFTKNGLGFKTEKDYRSNLREDSYEAYAGFLAAVIRHFDQEGLHFDYISPVNEPQWDWSRKYKEADQEGSPWRNEEIYKVTKALNAALETAQLKSKILVTEAGMLTYLYGDKGAASRQIQNFFDSKSPMYIGSLSHVPKLIAGHSYFTESNDKALLSTRKKLADTVRSFGLKYWQSEYSMLADGFREGSKDRRSNMDCALFLSKVIHADLTVGNAAAWQFWNAYEPGTAEFNTRYYLIALQPDADFKNGAFGTTKNLWALGHYSRFIRPGMTRVLTGNTMNSSKADEKNLMVSAYMDHHNKITVVGTNYGSEDLQVMLDISNSKKKYNSVTRYLTTAADEVNMKPEVLKAYEQVISLPARSISTIVID